MPKTVVLNFLYVNANAKKVVFVVKRFTVRNAKIYRSQIAGLKRIRMRFASSGGSPTLMFILRESLTASLVNV